MSACHRCETELHELDIAFLSANTQMFFGAISSMVELIGLTHTERRVEPERARLRKELETLEKRRQKWIEERKSHACTHPRPGRPKTDRK